VALVVRFVTHLGVCNLVQLNDAA